MSSKKKHKRSCPFSSAKKKAPKRKTSKVFHKEWAKVVAARDKGSYFEQDKLLELDGLNEDFRKHGFLCGFAVQIPRVASSIALFRSLSLALGIMKLLYPVRPKQRV